jgi:archaetidylinositol phosphate synthase
MPISNKIAYMNITSLRPKIVAYIEPIAGIFIKIGITPNQISLLSLLFGFACAILFIRGEFLLGSGMLFISALLDLVDGSVARRRQAESRFGAVIDWIFDKYVDSVVLLSIGLSGIPIISNLISLPTGVEAVVDFGIIGCAIIGSVMNTFIKPVVYAEIGYSERFAGKISDPLEGVGFFGRPETLIVIILGGFFNIIWISVLVVAVCTNLSALQRIIYLYRRFS